jgi:uncharacterized membrane protein YccC
MSQPSTISERLLAHARLCREIADATLNEETARKLERLAQDCIQAARDAAIPRHSAKCSPAWPGAAGQLADFIPALSPFSWLTKSFHQPSL